FLRASHEQDPRVNPAPVAEGRRRQGRVQAVRRLPGGWRSPATKRSARSRSWWTRSTGCRRSTAPSRALCGAKAALADTGTALQRAKERVGELQLAFNAADKPTKKLSNELERARRAVQNLTRDQNRQQAALTGLSGTLAKAGVETKNLDSAQRG